MNHQDLVGRCGFHRFPVKHQPRLNWATLAAVAMGFCTGFLLDKYIELAPELWEAVRDLSNL